MTQIGEQILMVTSGAKDFARSLKALRDTQLPAQHFELWFQRLPEEIEFWCGEETLVKLRNMINRRLESGQWEK
jgi:hypothetical protein